MGRKSNTTLAIRFPELIKEWHVIKNGNLTPFTIEPCSTKRVWWACKNNHEWESTPHNRAKGRGCPYCSNQKVNKENSLTAKFPEIAKEWHPTKNGELTPNKVTAGSELKIWWLCSKEHEWYESICSRHRRGRTSGCPVCFNKKSSPNNTLASTFPAILKEWDYDKNTFIQPEHITPHSGRKVWWQCMIGHTYESIVRDRTGGNNTGCPYCAWTHTKLEKYVETKLGINKFNKNPLLYNRYYPDFKLSDNLYLNVDGLFWHSELYKSKDYHFKLREAFELESKRILQFYEDEIYYKWSIVESIINNILLDKESDSVKLYYDLNNPFLSVDYNILFCNLRYSTGTMFKDMGYKLDSLIQSWGWTDNRCNWYSSNDGNKKCTLLKVYDAGHIRYIKEDK